MVGGDEWVRDGGEGVVGEDEWVRDGGGCGWWR